MNIDEATIQRRCTDAVFERGVNYRDEGRIQRLDRFDNIVTATVQGSSLYDVTVKFGDEDLKRGVPVRTTGGATASTSSLSYWMSP